MHSLSSKTERIHGIDFLRVLLSLCAIMIHVLHYGGPRTQADPSTPEFYALWLLGAAITCTVNCFALVSGFVLYGQEFKYTNILRLYFAVLYHGLVITALFNTILPDTVSQTNRFMALLPVTHSEFWYFTAHFGLFFFVPLLTNGMQSLQKKQADILIASLFFVFSVLPTATGKDPFHLQRGYSTLWLMILFIAGTYLRKYYAGFKLRKSVLIAVYISSVLLSCFGVVLSVFNPHINGMRLIDYTSPTIVLAAVAVILLFASMSVPKFICKISNFCAPFAFSIYLLHEHPLIRQNLIQDKFISILSLPALLQIFSIPAIALVIWSICFGMECIRRGIFRLLNFDSIIGRLEGYFQ